MSLDLAYIALLLALFVIPRLLQRFRIPSAVSSLGLGLLSGMGLERFRGDPTVGLLSTFGIVALFLVAGLEVDVDGLRSARRVLAQHLAIRALSLALVTVALGAALGTDLQASILVALALITPSTGFILDSLDVFHLTGQQRFWVKTKAIATEIVALGVLFVVVQAGSLRDLGLSTLALVALVVALPTAFRLFARHIIPYAPRSEFTFLVIVAVTAAVVTKHLGAYYLVGAFLVGLVARRCREFLPTMVSERTTHAVELFAAFFAPFYFFHAGVEIRAEDLSWGSLLAGLAFVAVMVPYRVGGLVLHRRLALGEPPREGLRTAVALLPTLVFTLVLADLVRTRFQAPAFVFGGLVFYAVATTLFPGFVLRLPPPDYEAPRVEDPPELEVPRT